MWVSEDGARWGKGAIIYIVTQLPQDLRATALTPQNPEGTATPMGSTVKMLIRIA